MLETGPRPAAALGLATTLLLLSTCWAACSTDDPAKGGAGTGGSGAGTSGECEAAKPVEGGPCAGLLSCTYGDQGCSPGASSHTYDQCICEDGGWACHEVKAPCGEGGGGGSGGGGMGGVGGVGGAGGSAGGGGSGGTGTGGAAGGAGGAQGGGGGQ